MNTEEILNIAIERAEKLCHNGQYDSAATFCKQVIKIDPDNSTAWFLLGICERFIGTQIKAYEALTKAVELSPVEENRKFALAMRDKIESL